MLETAALKFTINAPGERERVLSVDTERVRIGSAAFCEIRLGAEDAAPEHLLIQAVDDGVSGEARSRERPTLLDGSGFVRGRLSPESVLRIGRVEIRVTRVERALPGVCSKPRRTGSRLLYALGGVGIPLGILFAGPRSEEPLPPWSLRPEPLWSGEEPAGCPQDDPGSAAALAEKLLLQAESARERAPFSPEDGVAAVGLFAAAAACHATSGSVTRAEAARAASTALRNELEREFHVHQVRLERALVGKMYDRAKAETRLLLSFGAQRTGAYFDWLGNLDRQIDLKFSGSK